MARRHHYKGGEKVLVNITMQNSVIVDSSGNNIPLSIGTGVVKTADYAEFTNSSSFVTIPTDTHELLNLPAYGNFRLEVEFYKYTSSPSYPVVYDYYHQGGAYVSFNMQKEGSIWQVGIWDSGPGAMQINDSLIPKNTWLKRVLEIDVATKSLTSQIFNVETGATILDTTVTYNNYQLTRRRLTVGRDSYYSSRYLNGRIRNFKLSVK